MSSWVWQLARVGLATLAIGFAACGHTGRNAVPLPQLSHVIAPPELPEEPHVSAVGLHHLLRGLNFLAGDQPAAAIPHLRLALVHAPTSGFISQALSRAWGEAGHPERARRVLQAALERLPGDPWLSWLAGDVALRELRFVDATEHLEHAVRNEELRPVAGPLLVSTLQWRGELGAAKTLAGDIGVGAPGDHRLQLQLAECFEEHGALEESLSHYRRVRELRPTDVRGARGVVRVLDLFGEWGRAADEFLSFLAHRPTDAGVVALQARLLEQAGSQAASSYWREARRLTRGDPGAVAHLARQALAAGNAATGLSVLREFLLQQPEAIEPRLVLAEALMRRGDSRGCLDAVGVTATQPDPRFHRPRAWCWARKGRLDLALEQLTWSILQGPDAGDALLDAAHLVARFVGVVDAPEILLALLTRTRQRITPEEAILARAVLATQLGNTQEALDLLAQLTPESWRTPEMVLQIADLKAQNGALSAAFEVMRRLVRDAPESVAPLNALGFRLADVGRRLGEAEVYLRRAHRLAPDDGYVIDSLGWLQHRKGDAARAVELLTRANQRLPGEPEILWHLGEALRATGAEGAARVAWQAALENGPAPRLRARIEQSMEVGPS